MDASSSTALSLYQIARLHCRKEILTGPLKWTGCHLELLQCSFSEPSPAPPTTQSDYYTGEYSGQRCMRDYFRSWDKSTYREKSIRTLLCALECPLTFSDRLYFYLDRSAVKTLRCTSLYLRKPDIKSVSTELPIAALIDRGNIEDLRKSTLRKYRSRKYNPPVHAIFNKMWKKIDPTEPLHDPYIVGLLIAMAQQRRGILRKTNREEEAEMAIFPCQVLCTFKTKECMHLYTADIPSSLLDMFDYPTVPPPAAPSISVRITTISFKPYNTLRSRVLALILPETHTHLMGTHLTDEMWITKVVDGFTQMNWTLVCELSTPKTLEPINRLPRKKLQ